MPQVSVTIPDDLLEAIDARTTDEISRAMVIRTLLREAIQPGRIPPARALPVKGTVPRVEHKQVDLDPAKKPTAASVAKAVEDFATHGAPKTLERKEVDPRPK